MMPEQQKTPEQNLSPLDRSEKPTLTPREQLTTLTSSIIERHSRQTGLANQYAYSNLTLSEFLLAERVNISKPSDADSSPGSKVDLLRLSFCNTVGGIDVPSINGHSTHKDGTISRIQIRMSDGAVQATTESTVKREQPDRPGRFEYVPEVELRTFTTPAEEDVYIQEFLDRIELAQRVGEQLGVRKGQARLLGEVAVPSQKDDTV